MDVLSLELYSERPTDVQPLLMEQPGNSSVTQHVINITVRSDNSTTTSPYDGHITGRDTVQREDRSNSAIMLFAQPSTYNVSNGSSPRNSSFVRRGDNRQHRSPLNSGFWISVELVLIISQIVVSIVVLSVSKHEHPQTPLHVWIFGYAAGCVATLPLLYWRYYHSQIREQDSSQVHQTSPSGLLSLSVSGTNAGEDYLGAAGSSRGNQGSGLMNRRVKRLVEYFKFALDCFFAVWFVVGNVWIFSGHSSADDAPNLYRLCIVFLTFSCIGYAMPFILCATICCCLPCIISIIGFREDEIRTRGATTESINALPTYKFRMKKNINGDESNSAGEGGIVAAGTEKQRVISEEDAVCCICLANYENNDELRELPCSHFFHKDCVDKWLKINALCPLCKSGAGETATESESGEDARPQQVENSNHVDSARAHS